MSSYRNLYREKVADTSFWSVATTPLLQKQSLKRQDDSSSSCWRIWAASADGLVRGYRVTEKDLDKIEDDLNASAMTIQCTHVLIGTDQVYRSTRSPNSTSVTTEGVNSNDDSSFPTAFGATQISVCRQYHGEDTDSGDLIVSSIDISGFVRIWKVSETEDDPKNSEPRPSGNHHTEEETILRAVAEFAVHDATGTSAVLIPPYLYGTETVACAVGRLDGTVALVSTGLQTPKAQREEATRAGEIEAVLGSEGSSVPLRILCHPHKAHTLAVGRQNGMVDLLTTNRKENHRQHHHKTPVRALAFSSDGELLQAGSDQGLLTLWDCGRPKPALVNHCVDAHKSWVLDALPLPDGERFVTLGADQKICIWNVGQFHQPVHTFSTDCVAYTLTIRSSPNGNLRLVCATRTGQFLIYSLENKAI